MSVRVMLVLVTGFPSSARMPETTIDSSTTGFCCGCCCVDSCWRRRKRTRSVDISAFPYAGVSRIRFEGLSSGRDIAATPRRTGGSLAGCRVARLPGGQGGNLATRQPGNPLLQRQCEGGAGRHAVGGGDRVGGRFGGGVAVGVT